jgi:hypothetical protein
MGVMEKPRSPKLKSSTGTTLRHRCGEISVTSPAHGALANASVVITDHHAWTLPGNRAIGFSSKVAYGLSKSPMHRRQLGEIGVS